MSETTIDKACDLTFMRLALTLARRGLGDTWPNPSVGAVIVRFDDGAGGPLVIGRGVTESGGRPHAEVVALARARAAARGATLYVTLEPCAHVGRTPPCAEAIVAAGLARVVVACRDPDPRVAGRGIAILRRAGIQVDEGVGREEALWLNAGHALTRTVGRPFVQLKIAVDAAGRIAAGSGGQPVWVTGAAARARGHLLRAQTDAIVIGRGTAEADDPRLTCRLPGLGERSPLRVVLDSGLALAPSSRLVASAEEASLWLFCAEDAPTERDAPLLERGALTQRVPRAASGRGLDLSRVLAELAQRGITRILVEGGPSLQNSFLEAGLVDEVVVFEGGRIVQGAELIPFVHGGLERIAGSPDWQLYEGRRLDSEPMSVYRNRKTGAHLAATQAAPTAPTQAPTS